MNRRRTLFLYIVVSAAVLVCLGAAACCTFHRPDVATEQRWQALATTPDRERTVSLLDESGLEGWRVSGLGVWKNQDGVLSVERGIGYLYTPLHVRNFELKMDVRLSEGANSGLFFRARHPGIGLRPWPVGYEIQLDHADPENGTGALYDRVPADRQVSADGEWFSLRVHVVEDSIQASINDIRVMSATDFTYSGGFIALQAHHPNCRVEFRNMKIRFLP